MHEPPDYLRRSEPKNWVVETVGIELRTHHSVIEPVSATVRSGLFKRRDSGANSDFSLAGDRYRDYLNLPKARITREKCEDAYPSSIPEDWVVETVGLELVTHHPVIEPVSTPVGDGSNVRASFGPSSC